MLEYHLEDSHNLHYIHTHLYVSIIIVHMSKNPSTEMCDWIACNWQTYSPTIKYTQLYMYDPFDKIVHVYHIVIHQTIAKCCAVK